MNSRTNYSNFWFDRQTSIVDDLLADDTDDVKVKPKKDHIQLAANQRAIGNFVRIVSGKNIPVKYMTTRNPQKCQPSTNATANRDVDFIVNGDTAKKSQPILSKKPPRP